MEVVSFETALRLKEAGFPQPEVIEKYAPFYLVKFPEMGVGFARGFAVGHAWPERYVYAPTATDILRMIPGAALDFWKLDDSDDGSFYIHIEDHTNFRDRFFYHKNSAEVAAAAWLAIKK